MRQYLQAVHHSYLRYEVSLKIHALKTQLATNGGIMTADSLLITEMDKATQIWVPYSNGNPEPSANNVTYNSMVASKRQF